MTFADTVHAEVANYGLKEKRYIKAARDRYEQDGVIEFDDTPVVSKSEDGCYVMAWAWVSDDDLEPEPGPTYVVWSASPDGNDGWEPWQAEASFTCDDDPDGEGARQSAHEHARYLRRTYHGHLIAVRHHDRGLPLKPAQPVAVDPPYKDFTAAWLGL